MLGYGVNLWQPTLRGSTGPAIVLSAASIAENAAVGTTIGTLSVVSGSGVYTFAITADPDSKFALDGAALEVADALDYEAATAHSVTIEADNGVDPPLSRTFAIAVTNVFEQPNLAALTLSASTIDEASAENTVVGSIVGQTAGSTLTLTASAGNRFKLAGSAIVAGPTPTAYVQATSHSITVRETLADSPNSPRDTTLTITVVEAAAGPAGDGILLETGDYLLAENDDYLIQEAA